MGAVRDLVEELRRRGVTVHEWPGWDGRGNADGGVGPRITQINPAGAVIHHTGSNYGPAYAGLVSSTRPELLGGCLCNFAGNEDGSLTVIASGLAWHAGPGVGPSLGPVLAKIPNIRNQMNRRTVGLEIVYPGAQPMRKAQYKTALIFAKAVADLFAGGDPECVRAHAETNGNAPGGSGKWDPGCAPGRTIDMAAFRRDAALAASTPAPAASEEDDTVKYLAFRSDPETTDDRGRKGTGAVALAAPGQWYEVPNPSYFALLKARGVCGDWVNVPHNEFEYLRAVYLAPEGNDEAMVAALSRLSADQAARAAVDVDENAIGRIVIEGLLPEMTAELAKLPGVSRKDVEDVLRGVLSGGLAGLDPVV